VCFARRNAPKKSTSQTTLNSFLEPCTLRRFAQSVLSDWQIAH
jgi:hypothetical protein